jgi:hypothetical protein
LTAALCQQWHEKQTYRGQFLNELVALPQGCESDFLAELCECGIGKEGDVANQLVNNVRLCKSKKNKKSTQLL